MFALDTAKIVKAAFKNEVPVQKYQGHLIHPRPGRVLPRESRIMKGLLFERTEMAKALNFGKYPVLSVDLDNKPYPSESYVIGCNCRVAWDSSNSQYEGMTSKCWLEIRDGQYILSRGGTCLKIDYCMDDFLAEVKNANTPLVHKGQVIAIAHYSRELNLKFVRLMKMSDRIDVQCADVAALEPIEE